MSKNDEIARELEAFADLLEAKGVEYKPRAYRRAAENIRDHTAAVDGLATEGEDAVAEIEAVGDAISAKIVEYVDTGEIAELETLREELPVEMEALTSVEGVGPKTVGRLYEELGIKTLDDLEAAAEAGNIRDLSGFGQKTEANILDGIPFAREAHQRELLGVARPRGEAVCSYLDDVEAAEQVALAGSIRRWKPTIGDVDVLVGSTDGETVITAFTEWDDCDRVLSAGTSKATIRADAVQIDLRVVDPTEFGAALQYFTGSKNHNVAVRNRAIDRELKVNEYGVFDVSAVSDPEADQRIGDRVAGESETGVYDAVGLSWIPPELRENRGELAAAAADDLPPLVESTDIRGDLHTHTTWSDGSDSISEMVEAAMQYGHDYVAITDHASGPGILSGVGLDDDEIREQLDVIRRVGAEHDITVLAGIEANIHTDGSVSVSDDVLADLDIVIAAPHSSLDGDGTDRLCTAARHPEVDVIAHPTGRRLNQRAGMDLDMAAVGEVAAEHDTALEINAHPRRLDLSGHAVKQAIEQGAKITINTDAHAPAGYDHMRFGVHTARRGWATADDILNAGSIESLREVLN